LHLWIKIRYSLIIDVIVYKEMFEVFRCKLFSWSCITVLFSIDHYSALQNIENIYRSFSFRPSACYLSWTVVQTADEIILCTRITEVKGSPDIHLCHIIWVFHYKPLVFSLLLYWHLKMLRPCLFNILYMVLVLNDNLMVLFNLNFILLQPNLLVNLRSSIVSSAFDVTFLYLILWGLLNITVLSQWLH
jgi:hypothetical protein